MRLPKQVLSGAIFVLLGAGAVAIALGYPLGTAGRMGPGYFPALVGGLLALIGLAKLGIGLASHQRADVLGGLALRPMLLVPCGVAAFALLLLRFGLIPAIAALVLLACLAGPRLRPLEALMIFAVVSIIAGTLWVEGLGFPIQSLVQLGT